MLNRQLTTTIKPLLEKTGKSIAVLGPRQTGKSTLLQSLKPKLIIDLADEAAYRDHMKDPGLLRAMIQVLPKKSLVMVDEIQRIPSMLNTIQSLIDHNKDLQFMLTGSSARKLRRGHANLLPGRLFWYHLFPLTFWELKEDWDLEKALKVGTLPEVYLNDYGEQLLLNYINTYLREEIQAEALVRNVDSYARFLDVAAEVSGKISNYSDLASDSEIPKETIRRFFDILVDTLIVHRIKGFTAIKGSRKATQKEMFIFFDLGVRHAILKQQRNVFSNEQMGHFFEQWIALQMIAFSSYHDKQWDIYYYRDDLQQEVDYVVDCGKYLLAVEVKWATKFKPEFLQGLKAFEKYAKKPVKSFIVYRGKDHQKREGVEVVPYEHFLGESLPEL